MANALQKLHNYLEMFTPENFGRLYRSPTTCLAMCRYVSPIAQQLIIRLMILNQPISSFFIDKWIKQSNKLELREAIETLKKLQILQEFASTDVPNDMVYALTPLYAAGLKTSLLKSDTCPFKEVEVESKHQKTTAELENYALERWESVLRYLALPSEGTERTVSAETRNVLQEAGLLNITSDGLTITSYGFQFLLMDYAKQIWSYLIHYLKYMERTSMSTEEAISFLLSSVFCSPNKSYATDTLSPASLNFVQHLREIGLIYQRKRKAGWFRFTTLSAVLSNFSMSVSNKTKGFLIVETNFRLYAFTDSVLQLAIISTFCDVLYRFPNLAIGALTRESVRKAFQVDITAAQIIDYMRANAKEQMLKQNPVIPSVVTDQLYLWEVERDRFKFEDGVLYSNFLSDSDFTVVRNYAKELEVLLWENAGSRLIIVTPEGHETVKQFWKKQKTSSSFD